MHDKVFIIVLNWNHWQETVECVKSLRNLDHENYRIIVIDNGSTNDSIGNIRKSFTEEIIIEGDLQRRADSAKIIQYQRSCAESGGVNEDEDILENAPSNNKLLIVKNNENLGFAAGCNVGIRYALSRNADYVWILNNDTVVDRYSLTKLVDTLNSSNQYRGITPQIRYFSHSDKIWNCGGELTWYGTKKYYHHFDSTQNVPDSGIRKVTFITGCAFLLPTAVFREIGLFSERFFMGEEDFEFSHRLLKNKIHIACRYDAIIYHKVSVSVQNTSEIGKVYIDYLNRMTCLKFMWPKTKWLYWRAAYSAYIFLFLKLKHKMTNKQISTLIQKLLYQSGRLDGVDREEFKRSLSLKF